MKIVSISGLDGSGKSTQIKLLKNHLESQGERVFYFHAIQFGVANKITKIFNYCHPEQSRGIPSENNKSVTEANKLQIWLRKMFLRIDLKRFKSLIKKLEKEGCGYLLTDRYFYDSVVNIEYLENTRHSERSEESRTNTRHSVNIQRFFANAQNDIVKPAIAIYLQTNPETIMRRERKPDQGIEYLRKKKEIYDNYAGILNLKIIDGNRTQEEVFEEIKRVLG